MSSDFKGVVDQNTEQQQQESQKIPNFTGQNSQNDARIKTDKSKATQTHTLEKRNPSKLSQLENPRTVKKHKNSPRFVVRGGETEGVLWSLNYVQTLCFPGYNILTFSKLGSLFILPIIFFNAGVYIKQTTIVIWGLGE